MKRQYEISTLSLFIVGVFLSHENLPAQQQTDYYFPKGKLWETVSAEELGWNQKKLEAAFDYAGSQKSSAVVILHKGKLVAEKYWDMELEKRGRFDQYKRLRHKDDDQGRPREDVASVQKSVTSVLVGIAVQQGKLKLSDRVDQHLGEGWTKASREQESRILVSHLLSMTTGLTESLSYQADPGTKWRYSNNIYYQSVKMLEAITKTNRNELTRKWLTGPLGMNDSLWVERAGLGGNSRRDPKYGFVTSARDLAKFGLMVLADGTWDGKPILKDREYRSAMSTSSQKLNPSYGYFWWLNGKSFTVRPGISIRKNGSLIPTAPKDMFAAMGAMGRKVFIVPSFDLVVVRIGDAPEREFDDKFWSHLSKAIK